MSSLFILSNTSISGLKNVQISLNFDKFHVVMAANFNTRFSIERLCDTAFIPSFLLYNIHKVTFLPHLNSFLIEKNYNMSLN